MNGALLPLPSIGLRALLVEPTVLGLFDSLEKWTWLREYTLVTLRRCCVLESVRWGPHGCSICTCLACTPLSAMPHNNPVLLNPTDHCLTV